MSAPPAVVAMIIQPLCRKKANRPAGWDAGGTVPPEAAEIDGGDGGIRGGNLK